MKLHESVVTYLAVQIRMSLHTAVGGLLFVQGTHHETIVHAEPVSHGALMGTTSASLVDMPVSETWVTGNQAQARQLIGYYYHGRAELAPPFHRLNLPPTYYVLHVSVADPSTWRLDVVQRSTGKVALHPWSIVADTDLQRHKERQDVSSPAPTDALRPGQRLRTLIAQRQSRQPAMPPTVRQPANHDPQPMTVAAGHIRTPDATSAASTAASVEQIRSAEHQTGRAFIPLALPTQPGGAVKRPAKIGAVLFDLDGTLVDTRPTMRAALHRMLLTRGRGERVADIEAVLANGFPAFMSQLGLDHESDQYWHAYEDEADAAVAFAWVPALLTWLHLQRIPVAVVTNLPGHMAWTILKQTGLAAWVQEVIGSRDAPPKPDPAGIIEALRRIDGSAAYAIMVGDSAADIQAAQRAGCIAVGVGWGFRPSVALGDARADLVFEDPAAFTAWLQNVQDSYYASRCGACPAYVYVGKNALAQCQARCSAVSNVLTVPTTACMYCADPRSVGGAPCTTCAHRLRNDAQWVTRTYCAWLYTDGSPLIDAVHRLKGVNQPARADVALGLGQLFLAASFRRAWPHVSFDGVSELAPAVLVPVPTSEDARSIRGYAPVEKLLTALFAPLLARQVPTLSGVMTDPFYRPGVSVDGRTVLDMEWEQVVRIINGSAMGWHVADVLRKVKAVEIKQMTAAQRTLAVRGAYTLSPDAHIQLRGQMVYLVDDLMTTGATANECARMLRDAGARDVQVIALARRHS